MTVSEWFKASQSRLIEAGIETARLDCLVLLEDASGKDRSWLLAHQEVQLQAVVSNTVQLHDHIKRRAKHEPIAYIRQQSEFYGRTFYVNADVLEPRPETEAMIEWLHVTLPKNAQHEIVDVGTGSGALAITAALEFPCATVTAVDIDPNCLAVARRNARAHGVDIDFFESDLLSGYQRQNAQPLVLLCNLPYVPLDFPVNTAASWEPDIALYGGSDGLDLYKRLFEQIRDKDLRPTHIACESLTSQHIALAALAAQFELELHATDGLLQVFTPNY